MLADQLRGIRVLPVAIVQSEEEAIATVSALRDAGMRAIEITLRSEAALAAIRAVKLSLPDFIVAAGTVLTVEDLEAVNKAGVDFAVSPGFTPRLSDCARSLKLPFLPGVSTASEIVSGIEAGHRTFKLFPAEAVGGRALLQSLVSPFTGITFCPTGGIGPHNFRDYLALPNVICVGGSWMVDPQLIRSGRWDEVEELARQCITD